MATRTKQQDMIEVLVEDHHGMEELFTGLEVSVLDPETRRQAVNVVIAELVRHSVAEEQYLYPTARTALADGDDIADHEIAEHAEAEQMMKQLEGVETTNPEFERLLGSLMTAIRHHVEEEERVLFPRLRQACSAEDLLELGRKVRVAKEVAPTRPRPGAPDHPPWNKLLNPGVGLVDRIRDALTGRATSPRDLR